MTAREKNHAICIHVNASDAGYVKKFAEETEIVATG